MRLVEYSLFQAAPERVKKIMLLSGGIPASIVGINNWNAIHTIENEKRKYRYIINEGSSRSSKSISLIDCYDIYARREKNKRMTVWRDTKTDCKKTILNDAVKHFKKTGRYKKNQEFNKTESIFTYSTGSTFEIHGTDDEETVHGLTQDVAWFNEPYKISRDTFDQIDQRTSDFIFIDWNPKKDHWIDDIKKDPRSLVIHSTFKDNPFCPEEQRLKILSYQPVKMCYLVENKLLTETQAREYNIETNISGFTESQIKELIRCRENEVKKSASEYKWMVYGLGLKAERPHRIFHWDEIPEHEYKAMDLKVYYGVDWGTVDPWGIVEAKYNDGCLYLHELNYDSENKIREKLSAIDLQHIKNNDDSEKEGEKEGIVTFMFNRLQISKSSDIICDNNRKSKIQVLRKNGWRAMPAPKKPGSVEDGIDLLNELKVYYTHTSENLKNEQENYSRLVDRYGIVLEEPEDTNNHCFVGKTKISTPNGHKKIIDLKEGDEVYTQFGVNKIAKKFINGRKEVWKFNLIFKDNENQSVICTPTHKVYTKEKGWIAILSLKPGMTVIHFRNSTERNIIYTKGKNIFQKVATGFMSLYTNIISGKFQKATMCITKTKINSIITHLILKQSKDTPIFQTTCKRKTKTYLEHVWITPEYLHLFGTGAMLLESGTESTGLPISQRHEKRTYQEYVSNVDQTISHQQPLKKQADFVQINVNQNGDSIVELIKLKENARIAEQNLQSTNTLGQEHVVKSVQMKKCAPQNVYDLMIENDHSYFAENILVHNCLDPTRYIAQYLQYLGIIKRI